MSLTWVSFALTTLIWVFILVAWFGLIFRRRRSATHADLPPQTLQWNSIFGDGIRSMVRSRAALGLPLAAIIVAYAASFPRRAPSSGTGIIVRIRPGDYAPVYFPTKLESSFDVLANIVRVILPRYVGALGRLDSAMLSVFHSYVTVIIFFFAAAYLLLRSQESGLGAAFFPSLGGANRRLLGVASALAGTVALAAGIAFRRALIPDQFPPVWMLYLFYALTVATLAFVNAVMLLLLKAAVNGEKMSLRNAVSGAEAYFIPLLIFRLIFPSLSVIRFLPFLLSFSLYGEKAGLLMSGSILHGIPFFEFLLFLEFLLPILFLSMISFVPVIIVLRRASIASAFRHCIELWAHRPGIAARFVMVSALFLMVPAALDQLTAPNLMLEFFFSFLDVTIGVFIAASMIVLYERITQLQEPDLLAGTDGV